MGGNLSQKITGEDRRAPEEEVLNDGITGWCGALFARQTSVRLTLDGLTKTELRWGWYLGKDGRGGAIRALHTKKRRNRLSRGSG